MAFSVRDLDVGFFFSPLPQSCAWRERGRERGKAKWRERGRVRGSEGESWRERERERERERGSNIEALLFTMHKVKHQSLLPARPLT